MPADLHTRSSLLIRLKASGSNRDWEMFYRQYGAVILSFCLKQGLDDFAARDVLQETMVLLIRKLPGFEYDAAKGLFRNWLLALVAGKVRDSQRRATRSQWVAFEDWHGAPAEEIPDVAHPGEAPGGDLEKAWRHGLVEEALRRLKADPRIRRETFAVFEAYALQGKPVLEVAQLFKLQENAVYQIKNRLLRRVREEVQLLENLDAS